MRGRALLRALLEQRDQRRWLGRRAAADRTPVGSIRFHCFLRFRSKPKRARPLRLSRRTLADLPLLKMKMTINFPAAPV